MSEKVLFDPGYAKHITILSVNIPYLYEEFEGIKNFNQKKIKFKLYYPKLLKMTDNNIGFCLGSLLWASYLKSQHKGCEIEGNPCFGIEYNEAETVEEINYSIEYYNKLKKDVKYYLNQEFQINPKYIDVLNIYREFLIANEGFAKVQSVDDIKLPQKIVVASDDDSKKIFEKIQEVIKNGNLIELFDVFDLICKE